MALDAACLVSDRILDKEVRIARPSTLRIDGLELKILQKHKLLGANHYSHVSLATVARIYIRLAAMIPDHVDLRKAADDIVKLADVLSTCEFIQIPSPWG